MIDGHAQDDAPIPVVHHLLNNVANAYKSRFGDTTPAISAEVLVRLYKNNPVKAKAFAQSLGATQTPDMLVMSWRILLGMTIAKVSMDYTLSSQFSLRFVLESTYDETEEYQSDDMDDSALLRHFAVIKIENKPMFDGLYPLTVKGF